MPEPLELEGWLAANGVTSVRLQAVNHDGLVLGKVLSVPKFLAVAEKGTMLADTCFGVDFSGQVALGWDWGAWRGEVADIRAQPDLDTLTADPALPGLASVICDFTDPGGEPLPICGRSILKRMIARLEGHGLEALVATEVEFSAFEQSIQQAREQAYRDLTPLGGPSRITYLISRSPDSSRFMDAAVGSLTALGIDWESWSNETAAGQFEINLAPTDALAAADAVTRTKLALREVAAEFGHCVTFMALIDEHLGASMHVNLSLTDGAGNAFHRSEEEPGSAPELMRRWVAGLLETLPAAMSFFSPTVNAYRRLVEIAGPPTTATWGHDNKSTAVRAVTRDAGTSRLELRAPAMDCNPYLALAAIIAGGLIGMEKSLEPPEPFTDMAWALPPGVAPRLPDSITKAADALESDELLTGMLGQEAVAYWLGSRRWERMIFHKGGGDPDVISDFELARYFEHA